MRCIGTLEFIDEFQENCQRTQQRLVTAKNSTKCSRIKVCSPTSTSLEDPESDKENSSPILTPSRKRKRQITTVESTKILKPLLLTTKKNLSISMKESDRVMAELSMNKNDQKNIFETTNKSDQKNILETTNKNDQKNILETTNKNDQKNILETKNKNDQKNILETTNKNALQNESKNEKKRNPLQSMTKNDQKNSIEFLNKSYQKSSLQSESKNDQKNVIESLKTVLTPSTKAKCDNSTKNESDEAKASENSSVDSDQFDRRTRSRTSNRNIPKKSLNESKGIVNSPKSKPVTVIVKLEKSEQNSQSSLKSNELVWIPNEYVALPEAEKPKSSRSETATDECPIAGDEAGKRVEKSPESSASRATTNTVVTEKNSDAKLTRKSVIEITPSKMFESREIKELKDIKEPKENKQTEETKNPKETKGIKMELRVSRSLSKKDVQLLLEEDEDSEEEEEEEEEERKKFGKIADLITEEQKMEIETFYTVDMSIVDEEVVGEKITFVDKKTFGCKICKATYRRQDKCQVHIWGHLEMRPYRCNACDFATVTVSNIRCHIRKSHLKIKPYACEVCEKRYVTAFLLEEHMNTHTGSRPYKCDICDFSSASRQVLSYHKSTHKPVKDITCHVCGKEFYSKGRMRAHMVIHNKDKAANMCKLCSIYLCNREALERHHANVHSKDYVCNICEKRCKSKKALNNHQNVHSAAKYKCNLCSNVYKSSHILKEHLLKHKGIRKYKCNTCGKDFAQQSHLAAHMAVHSEKRFFCPGCKRPFNRHDNMKMHTKRCEPFLANPELSSLLAIRRSRSKPVEKSPNKIVDNESNLNIDKSPSREIEQTKRLSMSPKSQRQIGLFAVAGSSNESVESEDLTMIIGNTVVIPCT